MGAQVAVSLVLLTVSVFIYRGFHYELNTSKGFRTDHLLMMSFDPSLMHYSDAQTEQFYKQVMGRGRAVPGVKSAALASTVPMSVENNAAEMVPEGFQFPAGKDNVTVFANRIDENYLDTMAVPLVRGRGFRETDAAATPRVAVVNEQFARHYWPGKDAIGKRLRVVDPKEPTGEWVEIVGVAKTGKYIWIAEQPMDFLYLPRRQYPRPRMVLLAESGGDSASLAAPLR